MGMGLFWRDSDACGRLQSEEKYPTGNAAKQTRAPSKISFWRKSPIHRSKGKALTCVLGLPSWLPKSLASYTPLPHCASIWRGFLKG